MLGQYLHTDADEDDTCPELGTEVDTLTEEDPDEAAQHGEQERHDADDDHRPEDALEGVHASTSE